MNEIKNNFGILKESDFEKLSEDRQLQILVDLGLYESFTSIGFESESVVDLSEFNKVTSYKTKVNPNYELREEFYTFFKAVNLPAIDKEFLFFSKDFEDEIFGMEYIEQRKVALKYFKDKFSRITPKDISLGYRSISESGLERVEMLNRFEFLKGLRSALKATLATDQNLKAYLIGDQIYFESDEFKKQETFTKAFEFESTLKILLSLNDMFQFEDDTAFSNLGILKERYKKYKNVFLDFDVFSWTQKKIQSFIDNKPSNIDSLHQALLESLLISEKKKNFIDYVNQEHNMSITKIRHYGRGENLSHDFRLKKIKEELQELTIKN
ncbi:hypothetical protein DS884_16395 [Tenacibaculum sp. E3R01]|nr:hypothetical protein DS884_16395 [Tenacibaculum sp. E3R01]